MNTLTQRLPIILLAAGSMSAAPPAHTILPGYWESVNKVVFPISKTTTDRRCITPKDVAKYLMGPSNHIYTCTYPTQSVGNGQVSFAGECVDKKGHRVQISGHGAYTETTLQMTADVTFRLAGIPISAEATTDAHRIGDACPQEAAK
jgi:hypothetical protein